MPVEKQAYDGLENRRLVLEEVDAVDPSGNAGNPSLEMVVGRLPADTPAGAMAMVQKVRDYESAQDRGPWRQRMTLVADDACQGTSCDYPLVFTHMGQTEGLADQVLPLAFERDRVYLYEYGSECIYDRKPDAAAALRRSIDEGTLLVNFTGHGSEVQLADEKTLETPGVQRTNGDRLFCYTHPVGKFDSREKDSAGDGPAAIGSYRSSLCDGGSLLHGQRGAESAVLPCGFPGSRDP
jgi:hypothetical protein